MTTTKRWIVIRDFTTSTDYSCTTGVHGNGLHEARHQNAHGEADDKALRAAWSITWSIVVTSIVCTFTNRCLRDRWSAWWNNFYQPWSICTRIGTCTATSRPQICYMAMTADCECVILAWHGDTGNHWKNTPAGWWLNGTDRRNCSWERGNIPPR